MYTHLGGDLIVLNSGHDRIHQFKFNFENLNWSLLLTDEKMDYQ